MTFISYAQNFEDVLLWRALGGIANGFYIDVGAAHPDIDSVTRAFYERGWRGINIEPVGDYVQRLRASRPEDTTLELALSDASGEVPLYVVPGTGLSTLDLSVVPDYTARGLAVQRGAVATDTLAAVCLRHAGADIHFLKVDVEGHEARVLAGADFVMFRPWIVVVEATAPLSTTLTHADWEPILLDAAYRFVWFDGLNRFYVAAERHADLARHFAAPPNVFDDFVRAADTEFARRIAEAETRATLLAASAEASEARAAALAARTHAAETGKLGETMRASETAIELDRAREACQREAAEVARLQVAIEREQRRNERMAEYNHQAASWTAQAQARAQRADDWLLAIRQSNSWRITAPARRVGALWRGGDHGAGPDIVALPRPPDVLPPAEVARPQAPALAPPAIRLRRTVHQFHSGSAAGDAITAAMLLTRTALRGLGYTSDIFVEHVAPELAHELRPFAELPGHDDYVLILRHSTGYGAFERVVGLPAPKILIYHNITPPEFLGHDAFIQQHAAIGREQLASLRDRVVAALGDSDFNVLELRRLGFEAPRVCTLLFDIDALLAAAARRAPERNGPVFTVLFVGRLIESKAQADLIDAFARFRAHYRKPARLVLVGRSGSSKDAYRDETLARIQSHRLGASVLMTGLVSNDALHDWYSCADLYVSLSHHEGFGVPLIEAVAHGVPVLAWPSGAIGFTLGEPSGLLRDRSPHAVAVQMAELAHAPAAREALADRQFQHLGRFRLDAQLPTLVQALTRAGAAPPERSGTAGALAEALRFTVEGHVNKTYSLAGVNRAIALAIEAERPGHVRLVPVETVRTDDLSQVPRDVAAAITKLTRRPAHASGPEIVISQHYPVHVPAHSGDAAVALFYWEESLVPAATIARLNSAFRAVLAPSAFVAKALVDSGLCVPVHVVGHAPPLDAYLALPARARPPGRTFTFLHVSSGFPRKGVDVLLTAYAASFRQGDPVRLIVKTFPNPHNDVADRIASLRATAPDLAEIELVDRDLDEAGLLALYGQADAVVLPTRGEGFNLPAAEALAAGAALIVTGFGGHLDFCRPGVARLVDWRFAPSSSHLATPHSVWAEPDVDDLAAAMREAAHGGAITSPAARQRDAIGFALGRKEFVQRLTRAAVATLLEPPPAPVRIGLISTWDVRCGVAEYTRHLVEHLPPSAAVESLVIFADERTTPQAANAAGVRVIRAWQGGHPEGIGGLIAAIAHADPHVVLLQHQPGLFHWGTLASLLTGLAPRLVIVTLHNTLDLLGIEPRERAHAIAALAGAARVIVHTVADLNRLREFGLIANVAMMPHGAPVSIAQPSAPRVLPDTAAPLIGCYGFALPDKGIPELIDAVARLRRRWPAAKLRLVNAEYDHPDSAAELARCRRAAQRARVADAIEWHTDFLPDAESLALLAPCDVIALPYQRSKEASSAAVRLALAAGAPVMTTDLPLFEEAGNAIARSAGTSAEDIERTLGELLGDPGRRAALQSAAHEWLDSRNWSDIGRRLQGMMIGLVRMPARPTPAAATLLAETAAETFEPAFATP